MGDDPAFIHYDDEIGDLANRRHVMLNEDHELAILLKPSQKVQNARRHFGVDARYWLVKKQDPGFCSKAAGKAQQLLLAVGEVTRLLSWVSGMLGTAGAAWTWSLPGAWPRSTKS